MPGYKGHIAGAAVLTVPYVMSLQTLQPDVIRSTSVLNEWQTIAGLFVIAMLFGLFPDIDTNSKGQNLFYAVAFVCDMVLLVSGRIEAAAFLGLVAMLPILGKHRGWTHSRWAAVAVPLPIFVLAYLYRPELASLALVVYGAAVVGYASHLLLDGKLIKGFRIKGARY